MFNNFLHNLFKHGRLKVRTSTEEAARKKKEQELKVKFYYEVMEQVQEKRKRGGMDKELIELTSRILCVNPDVYSLWNIRKECVLKLNEFVKNQEMYDRELYFTENCLHVNPKSYGAWHHRCWILKNAPEPNWNREVDLCSKYLKLDERNFHCWDYRRFVVKNANINPENEFKFCTEKIEKNFSNYSSWHYRSKLLPILHPHENNVSRPISEVKLKEELELVLTAAFTDPGDSSAWFYQRWLLGYSAPNLDFAAFRLYKNIAVVAFTIPINLRKNFIISSNFSSEFQFKSWIPVNSDNNEDHTWILNEDLSKIDEEIEPKIILLNTVTHDEYEIVLKKVSYHGWIGLKMPKFEYEFGSGVIDELKTQLNSCNHLLEFEPDSKWTLLTATLLMRAINRRENHLKTLEYLKKLEKLDMLRKVYYQDLASKWQIQNKLETYFDNKNFEPIINLSNLELSTIFYENYLSIFTKINLSENVLQNKNLGKMKYFHCCNTLNLKKNKITSVENIPCLPNLGLLDLDRIEVDHEALFKQCTNITMLYTGDAMLQRCFCNNNKLNKKILLE